MSDSRLLYDVWKCLPADLVAVSDQWTYNEIVGVMENTRLLHSELCDLLKMFTLGYSSLLLGFFTSSFISMLLSVYFIVNAKSFAPKISSENGWEKILPLGVHIQIATFLMSITIFVSLINKKVTKGVNRSARPYTFIYIH
ncbi:Uncharacterized protein FWK35_00024851 [Aphis craccivora]|uniref:Gustatory receptor n=1 Tax=Aphis craccivora TaxID=307492 RepID=A0A6G0XW95_APHCR|nr:Uncharacterized protein FWK35_00024851 [Aphis craccivora]